MSATDMVRTYSEIRERLINPANAVSDSGIDLKRKRIPEAPKPKKVLEEVKPEPPPTSLPALPAILPPNNLGRLKAITKAVCTCFKIDRVDLWGPSRAHSFIFPRHIAWYLICTHTRLSTPAIGRYTALRGSPARDHTSIMHGRNKIRAKLETDEYTRTIVRLLEYNLFTVEYREDGTEPTTSCASTGNID